MDKQAFTKAARLAVMQEIDLEEYGLEGTFYVRPLTGTELAEARPRWTGKLDEKAAVEEQHNVLALSLCNEDGENIYQVGDPEVVMLPYPLVDYVSGKAMDLNGLGKKPDEAAEDLGETPGE